MPSDDAPVPARHGPVLTPSEAADRLGVGSAMLRRHAASYEAVFGPLPRDQRGARQYPITAVQRLQHAAELYRTNDAPSVADALTALRDGTTQDRAEDQDADLAPVPTGDRDRTLALLLTEVQAAQGARDRLADQLQRVLAILGGSDDEAVTGLQRRVIELQDEVRDLERRNRALLNELQERDQRGVELPDRPWWSKLLRQ